MKIIKPGRIPEEKNYRGNCRNCNCVFEFKQFEAKVMCDPRDGDYLQIDCPTCHKSVLVSQ